MFDGGVICFENLFFDNEVIADHIIFFCFIVLKH